MDYKLNLSENQRKKIAEAWKKKTEVTIQLKNNQLSGGNFKLSLTDRQLNKVEKAKKNNTGIRLKFEYHHLKVNHEGGFLLLLFAGLGALRALVGGACAVANSVINKNAKDKEL